MIIDSWRTRRFVETTSLAIRTYPFDQELADLRQSFLIIRPFEFFRHRKTRISEREIELMDPFDGGQGDMFLLRRAVEYDLTFMLREISERYIRAHPEFPNDIRLHVESKRAPRHDGPFIDSEALIRDECAIIHLPNDTGPLTRRTGANRIERQFLGGWRFYQFAAHLAIYWNFGGDSHSWTMIMAIGTAVPGKTRKHQP